MLNERLFTGCSVDWQLYKKNGLDERRVWEAMSEQRSWIWIVCGRGRLRGEKVEDIVKKFAKPWQPAGPVHEEVAHREEVAPLMTKEITEPRHQPLRRTGIAHAGASPRIQSRFQGHYFLDE